MRMTNLMNSIKNFKKTDFRFANSVYGKFIENTTLRMDCKFNTNAEQFSRNASSPLYKSHIICGENLTVSFLNKPKVDMRQVWPVGFSVLELSKLAMQELYYNVIQRAFGWACVDVVMSDTDSFLLRVSGYTMEEVREKLKDVMDFSNLHPDHPLYDEARKRVPGFLKDEMPNTVILQVIALKPKTYAMMALADEVKMAARG